MEFLTTNAIALSTLMAVLGFLGGAYKSVIFRTIGLSANAKDSVSKGWTIKGNPDAWRLIASASNSQLGIGYSTKVLLLPENKGLIHIKTMQDGVMVESKFFDVGLTSEWVEKEWKISVS